MMENKEQGELLEKIFSNVNSWLNFAEVKHAANLALVVACLDLVISASKMNILTCGICILLICSGGCSLLSFYPKLKEGDNLLYFEKIKNYSRQDYLKQVKENYLQIGVNNTDKYLSDLSDEIVINSKIVSRKYKLFQWVIKLDFVAFLLLIICFIMA